MLAGYKHTRHLKYIYFRGDTRSKVEEGVLQRERQIYKYHAKCL